ncbi:MAG: hypothetical protein Q7V88_02825 [Actinomycetota bacterium]|nr:hypothetical protein [Actinomycetota bacterium]
MNAIEFVVAGDAGRAKATVVDALQSRKFKLTWSGEWDATAERGSKIANALAGALAQYFKVGVMVRSAPDGNGVIRLEKSSKGYMGGAVGAHRTTKNFDALSADLETTFGAAGVLVHVQRI